MSKYFKINFRQGFIFYNIATKSLLYVSGICLLLVLYEIGFKHLEETTAIIRSIFDVAAILVFVALAVKIVSEFQLHSTTIKSRLPEYFLFLVLFLILDSRLINFLNFHAESGFIRIMASKAIIYTFFTALFFIELSKQSIEIYHVKFNPALVFVASFISLILMGTGLLLLPNATVEGGISFIDALFTSTSAVCVTGLIVMDTATEFTFLGQLFILILIQLGGLGIMTFASFFGFFFRGNTTYHSQFFLRDLINEDQLGQIFRTLLKIISFTFLVEALGVFFIYMSLSEDIDTGGGRFWFSVFHAISGFCNAGFSTLTGSLYEPGFRTNYNLHLVIAILIIIGGLGFPVILNLVNYIKSVAIRLGKRVYLKSPYLYLPRLINVNTKIVIYTTIVLLLFGAISFYIGEMNNTLAGKSLYGKVVTVIFGSVTPRTAGFNTIDMGAISMSTILIYLFLMWVGASPGSTGGGIKTSSFALAVLNTISIAKGKDRVEAFRREINNESIRRVLSIILLSFLVIGMAIFLITLLDPRFGLIEVIFECFSAYSTVGLSLGITPLLSVPSKTVIIITMFIGRVGSLTLIIALMRKVRTLSYRYPRESIFIN